MILLLSLPNELIRAIFQYTDIADIARLQMACGREAAGTLREVRAIFLS